MHTCSCFLYCKSSFVLKWAASCLECRRWLHDWTARLDGIAAAHLALCDELAVSLAHNHPLPVKAEAW